MVLSSIILEHRWHTRSISESTTFSDTSDASHKTQNAAGTITSCNLGRVGSHECAELMGIHALELPWAGDRPGGPWEQGCWSACADSRRRSGARCDTLFECNQSAPFDRVSNRYWKPEELCAGMTGAYLRQAASQRPSGMHCIAENRVMREVDCRGCLRLEYSLNFSCLYYTSILVLPLH